jgi:rhodanese-related sulfurtransferase
MTLRIWRLAVLLGASVALGLVWNAVSGRGFALSANAFLKEGDEVVEAAEAKRRLEAGALLLDARPVEFYNMSHIPGARPLPENDFDRHFAAIEGRLRSTFDIVVYCSGYGCEASHQVARRLREKGIQAAILNEGWPAWTDAGYPVKEGPEP